MGDIQDMHRGKVDGTVAMVDMVVMAIMVTDEVIIRLMDIVDMDMVVMDTVAMEEDDMVDIVDVDTMGIVHNMLVIWMRSTQVRRRRMNQRRRKRKRNNNLAALFLCIYNILIICCLFCMA